MRVLRLATSFPPRCMSADGFYAVVASVPPTFPLITVLREALRLQALKVSDA